MQPRRQAHEPPCATPQASPLAPGGCPYPDSIPLAVGPLETTFHGITYRSERITLVAKRISSPQTSSPPAPAELDREERSIAAKVFELLTALDPNNRLRKAPPIKVFLLRFRQSLSRTEIARVCRCDKSLVAVRLKTIQEKLPWRPQQLQELSAHVEAMQDAVSDSRARRIYRKGAASGDEDGGEGID
jgi:hypothetical protein